MNNQGRLPPRSSKRQASLELAPSSKRKYIARSLGAKNTLEARTRDLIPISPMESDHVSSTVPHHTTSPMPTVIAQQEQQEQHTHPSSSGPFSNEQNPGVPRLFDQSTQNLPLVSKPSPLDPEVLDGAPKPFKSSSSHLARISVDIDELSSCARSAFDGVQTMMEKHLGEISLARGELFATHAEDTRSRTQGTWFVHWALFNV